MIRKHTKLLSLLLAGVLSFSLAACGGSQTSGSPSGSAAAEDAGSAGTAESAASSGTDAEGTGAASGDETNESGEAADPVQDGSESPAYKTADYIQEETVIADTDQYKVTVTGYDPDYAQGDQEGFLIHMTVENKADKEYTYMVTRGSVNHVTMYVPAEEVVVPAGESAQMDYLINASVLEADHVSSVDAVSVSLQAMSSEMREAFEAEQTDVLIQLQQTDVFHGNYSFSPTGMDYDAVAPSVSISEGNYDIIADNDMITLGVRKNEAGSVFDEHGIFAGFMIHTDKTEEIIVEAKDFKVDGNSMNQATADGEIVEVPYTSLSIGSTLSNIVFPQVMFIDDATIKAYNIEEADTIEFTISVLSANDYSELYSETFSYSLK